MARDSWADVQCLNARSTCLSQLEVWTVPFPFRSPTMLPSRGGQQGLLPSPPPCLLLLPNRSCWSTLPARTAKIPAMNYLLKASGTCGDTG